MDVYTVCRLNVETTSDERRNAHTCKHVQTHTAPTSRNDGWHHSPSLALSNKTLRDVTGLQCVVQTQTADVRVSACE